MASHQIVTGGPVSPSGRSRRHPLPPFSPCAPHPRPWDNPLPAVPNRNRRTAFPAPVDEPLRMGRFRVGHAAILSRCSAQTRRCRAACHAVERHCPNVHPSPRRCPSRYRLWASRIIPARSYLAVMSVSYSAACNDGGSVDGNLHPPLLSIGGVLPLVVFQNAAQAWPSGLSAAIQTPSAMVGAVCALARQRPSVSQREGAAIYRRSMPFVSAA